MIIDFHTHCYPDAVAAHAMAAMTGAAEACPEASGLRPEADGTLDHLRRSVHEAGADYFVQLSVVTAPRHQYNVNQFALKVNALPDAFSFCGVHGAASDSLEELERMYDAGIKGVKLHPDEQMIDLADKKMYPVYDLISDLGLPVVIHTGFDPFSPDHAHASPARF